MIEKPVSRIALVVILAKGMVSGTVGMLLIVVGVFVVPRLTLAFTCLAFAVVSVFSPSLAWLFWLPASLLMFFVTAFLFVFD